MRIEVQGFFKRRTHLVSLIIVHVRAGQRGRVQESPDVESPTMLPTTSTRNVPAGRWMKVQGRLRRGAHHASLISVHVGVGQRCRAVGVESPALPNMSMRNVPAGRWMKVQGKFKMQADIISGVVMDTAAFKISHSGGQDAYATAL